MKSSAGKNKGFKRMLFLVSFIQSIDPLFRKTYRTSSNAQAKYWLHYGCFCLQASVLLYASQPGQAQVTADGSLSTRVSSADSRNFVIEQGDRAGSNLFHSFGQFSIPTNGSAYFKTPTDIQNIFSRVTGSSTSSINGLIKAEGTANLFLLNPNGIQFGSGAQLELGGSFYASTAQSVVFSDNVVFSATNASTPLLTVNLPTGLQFGQNPAPIEVIGSGHDLTANLLLPIVQASNPTQLQVHSGKTLALLGGRLNATGGIFTAAEGRVELGAIGNGNNPVVKLVPSATGFNLDYGNVSNFADITLDQRSVADASGSPGGSIQVVGANVNFLNGSLLLVQNRGDRQAGDIVVRASEAFRAIGAGPDNLDFGVSSGATNETFGSGKGGNIAVSTKRLAVLAGASLFARTYSSADSGNINVNASQSIDIIGFGQNSLTFSTIATLPFATGNGGDITVTTGGPLFLDQGGGINVGTLGSGNGGNLTVKADVITINAVRPGSLSDSNIGASNVGPGRGGNIRVNTRQLSITNGAQLTADNSGVGSAGTVVVNASEFIKVQGGIQGSFRTSNINASTLLINKELREVVGLPDITVGNSGIVEVNTPILMVLDGAGIRARNEGVGHAGTVRINAGLILLDNGGGIDSSSPVGNGGHIEINAHTLLAKNNGFISANANGEPHEDNPPGTAGDIQIKALIVFLDHYGNITASGLNDATPGTVNLETQHVLLNDRSFIAANTETGASGKITVSHSTIFLNDESRIISRSAQSTNSGIIDLSKARQVVVNNNSLIQAGNLNSNVDDLVTFMLESVVEPQNQLPDHIALFATQPENENTSLLEVESIDFDTRNIGLISFKNSRLTEASRWQINGQGQVELVNGNLE
jgi:filamentous hemagglutinin family protein